MLFNIFLIISVSSGVLYYFRKWIFRKVFWVCLFVLRYLINFYTYVKRTSDTMYRLEYKSLQEYVMDKYHLVENDKTHTIVFVTNNNNILYKHVTDFQTNVKTNLENKNLIVHSSITDDQGNIIMDLTELFRRFCYYYDKYHTMHGFFKYIDDHKREFKKNMSHINIYDYNFVVYLNDESFTEKTYPIKHIINENKTFNELLQIENLKTD